MTKKVLCLHGYSMNSDWFQSWCRPFEQRFTGEIDFIYPQGPIECPEDEVRKIWSQIGMPLPEHRLGKDQNWCWFRATAQTPPIYTGIDTSLKLLADVFARQSPIEGVIGWSQGAVLTTVLIAEQLRHRHPRFHFNWAVLGAGALPADPRFDQDIALPLTLPTLHIVGAGESALMKKRCDALFARFPDAQRLDPPVGHMLPLRYPQFMEQIYDWIKTRTG